MSYENWRHTSLSPLSIDLDPQNPRLPGIPEDANQGQIREEMFRVAKVREMVKSIAKGGFFPDQPIVVIRRNNKRFIVIEGNRRVCACQVLVKPSLAPDNQTRWLTKWVNTAQTNLTSAKKIRVVIAPNRDEATRLIVSKHLNVAPVNRWSRYAQGKFAINEFHNGRDIEDISETTGMRPREIKNLIKQARLFDVFLGLNWTDEEHAIILEHTENFPIEVLQRVLNNSYTHQLIGDVTYNQDGWPEFHWKKEKITPFLKRLVYDSLSPLSGGKKVRLTSRTINRHDDVKPYLADLPKEVLPNKAKSATSAESLIDHNKLPALGSLKKPTQKRAPRKRSPRTTALLSPDIENKLNNKKLDCLLEEAQTIKPESLPHASALLLRSILEIALIQRLKKAGTLGDCMAENVITKGHMPRLEQMIRYAAKSAKTLPDINLRKALQNDRDTGRLLMNLVAHNDQHVLTPKQVRDIAIRMHPLMIDLLN